MQPVGDVMSITKEYYVYIYIAGIFVIILISTIYSGMISKPLVRMNKSASKMAQLDFSVKCRINSNDELSELAGTLNFLSENLDKTLSELKSANEKLTEDIEKERELERMRREFVAGVSHELKTPVALIKGYAEGIKDGIAEGQKKEQYLDIIVDEADKMSALINDMLDLSKMEAGKLTLSFDYFNINGLIKKVVQKHDEEVVSKNISVRITSDTDTLVRGDEFRIEEVITNYFTNAVNHTDIGSKIEIHTILYEDHIKVEIENQGEPIPEEEIPRIWEKFYRIEKSRNRNLGGTGLGLAISKNILLLHQSDFGVYNTKDGVCFYFTLLRS
jgi:signal transduction histidine kinase